MNKRIMKLKPEYYEVFSRMYNVSVSARYLVITNDTHGYWCPTKEQAEAYSQKGMWRLDSNEFLLTHPDCLMSPVRNYPKKLLK